MFDCNAHLLGTSHQVYQLSSYKEACSICGGLMCSFLGLGQAWQQCGEHSLFFFVVFFQSDLKIFVSGCLERVCGVVLVHVSGLGCLKLG